MRTFFILLLLALTCSFSSPLAAQLRVSRQVLASTVQSATPANGSSLQFTAHAGETFIGTRDGDLRATVGFQQPDDDVTVATVSIRSRQFDVTTYPNPASRSLTVELNEAAPFINSLMLYDLYGRPLLRQETYHATSVQLTSLDRFPSGIYLLRGRAATGELVHLGRVMLVPME